MDSQMSDVTILVVDTFVITVCSNHTVIYIVFNPLLNNSRRTVQITDLTDRSASNKSYILIKI